MMKRSPNSHRKRHLAAGATLVAAGAIALSGCTQLDGLANSTGTPFMAASGTATDVLLSQDIDVLVKPVCEFPPESSKKWTCTGSTVDGEAIAVTITNGTTTDATMVITVGSDEIYNGSYAAVQTKAAQVPQ